MFPRRDLAGLAVGLVLCAGLVAEAVPIIGPNGSGSYNAYEIITGSYTWDQARVDAMTRSFPGVGPIGANPTLFGHLATLTSALENDYLALYTPSGEFWIGLTDSSATSTLDGATMPGSEAGSNKGIGSGWAWVTGEPYAFERFGAGEPNDSGGEDAVHRRPDGLWNDHQAGSSLGQGNHTLSYIIEWELNLPTAPPGGNPLLGVGPKGGFGFFGIREVRNNGTLNSVNDAINSLMSGLGTIIDGKGATVNHNDPNNPGGGGYFGNGSKAPFLSNTAGDDDDIAFLAHGYVLIPTSGMYTFGFRGDDGSRLRLLGAEFAHRWGGGIALGDTVAFLSPTGDSNTGAATYLDAGVHELEFIFFERGGGAFVELWAAPGDYSSFDGNAFRLVGDVANGGLGLVPEPTTLALAGLGLAALARRRRRAG